MNQPGPPTLRATGRYTANAKIRRIQVLLTTSDFTFLKSLAIHEATTISTQVRIAVKRYIATRRPANAP